MWYIYTSKQGVDVVECLQYLREEYLSIHIYDGSETFQFEVFLFQFDTNNKLTNKNDIPLIVSFYLDEWGSANHIDIWINSRWYRNLMLEKGGQAVSHEYIEKKVHTGKEI